MIYLIGGSPRNGKSILSKKLAKKLNIPYISTDDIRPIIMSNFKGEQRLKYFPFEKMFNPAAIDKYFQSYTINKMLKTELIEAKSMWLGIEALIKHLLTCKADYIIEGVHLLPGLVKQFKNNKNVKIVFLTKIDTDKILKGLVKNKQTGDWLIDNIKDKNSLSIAAKYLSDYGKYFTEESKKYSFKCFNTEDNFLTQINRITNNFL